MTSRLTTYMLCVVAAAGCGDNKHLASDAPVDAPVVHATQQAYVKASNSGDDAFFGTAVVLSADGSTMAISASDEASNATGIDGNQADSSLPGAGAVYVFVRTGTTWMQQAYVKAGIATACSFGSTLALSGDGSTLLVSAWGESQPGGAAYVFARTGTTWAQQAHLVSPTAHAGDLFGYSVSLSADGNAAAIGAYGEDAFAGGVHLFARSGTTWTHQTAIEGTTLPSFPAVANDDFGFAVALSGDGSRLAVGAIGRAGTTTNTGAVYTFSNGTLDGAPLVVTTGATGDNFGKAVALSNDGHVLAVGAPFEDGNPSGGHDAGAVHMFSGAGTFTEEARLQAANADAEDNFGASLALAADGHTLLVGAPGEASASTDPADNTAAGAGAGYVFVHGGAWQQAGYLKASNPGAVDNNGTSIAISGDASTFATGAPGESSASSGIDGDQNNDALGSSGAAYVLVVQ